MTTTFATTASIRFGYGRRPGETPPESVDHLLEQVERGVRDICLFPFGGIAGRRESFPALHAMALSYREARAKGTVLTIGGRVVNPYNVALANLLRRDQHLKVRQAVFSENGFHERLTAFWANHFTVDARKGGTMRALISLHEAEALRPNLAGPFANLLKAAILHPAMLTYLDQTRSVGPGSPLGLKSARGLNENLARELIELHTMGAGSGYTQDDVRSAAYVLTGLVVDKVTFDVGYRPRLAEPGVQHVLGRPYGGPKRRMKDVHALLADLAGREETSRHICRKLVVHFIADDPPEDVVDAMVGAWRRSDGRLIDVYRAMLEHPRSWEQEGQKARQPFDFVVAGLRALNVPAKALSPVDAKRKTNAKQKAGATAGGEGAPAEGFAMVASDNETALLANPLSASAIERLGQPIWSAPSPAGWDEGMSAWITASQITERIAFARRLVARFGGSQDPRTLLETIMADAARADTIEIVSRAPNRAAGLAMVLASPEFNRR